MTLFRWLLVGPLVILAVAVLLLAVPLPGDLPEPFARERNLPVAILTAVLGFAYALSAAMLAIGGLLGGGRAVAAALAPLGLRSRAYRLLGRHCHGTMEDRRVDVYYVPARSPYPSLLNAYVASNTGTRVAIVRRSPRLDCRDCARVAWSHAYLEADIFASDHEVARSLLDQTDVQDALGRLLGRPDAPGEREFYVQPERIWVRWRPKGAEVLKIDELILEIVSLAVAADGIAGSAANGSVEPA